MSDEWTGAHWFKSGESNDVGCVEVAFRGNQVGVRDGSLFGSAA